MFNFSSTYAPRWGIITIELTFKCYCNKDKLTNIRPYGPNVKLPMYECLAGRDMEDIFVQRALHSCLAPFVTLCVYTWSLRQHQTGWPTANNQSCLRTVSTQEAMVLITIPQMRGTTSTVHMGFSYSRPFQGGNF